MCFLVPHVLGRVRNLEGRHKDGSSIVISLEVNEKKDPATGKRTFVGFIKQMTEDIEALVTIGTDGFVTL